MKPTDISLSFIHGLGSKAIRQLFDIITDSEELYHMTHKQLVELFRSHDDIISAIESRSALQRAEQELELAKKSHIDVLFFTDPDYPKRFNQAGCEDTSIVLYRLGCCDLNPRYSVGLVGSRKCTQYGLQTTTRLVNEMRSCHPLIVSGLAYGIDTAAHAAALDNGLPTVAILGHGLDQIYPSQNRDLARRIIEHGGALLTEYPLYSRINAGNFPARNRLVAALSDAIVVTESAERGGALITANIATGYHRDVFAVPGRVTDVSSDGCNALIASNKAIMIRNAGDLFYQTGWDNTFSRQRQHEQQLALFATLTKEEQQVIDVLAHSSELSMEEICEKSSLPLPKIASAILNLELKKAIVCLPGRLYKAL